MVEKKLEIVTAAFITPIGHTLVYLIFRIYFISLTYGSPQ